MKQTRTRGILLVPFVCLALSSVEAWGESLSFDAGKLGKETCEKGREMSYHFFHDNGELKAEINCWGKQFHYGKFYNEHGLLRREEEYSPDPSRAYNRDFVYQGTPPRLAEIRTFNNDKKLTRAEKVDARGRVTDPSQPAPKDYIEFYSRENWDRSKQYAYRSFDEYQKMCRDVARSYSSTFSKEIPAKLDEEKSCDCVAGKMTKKDEENKKAGWAPPQRNFKTAVQDTLTLCLMEQPEWAKIFKDMAEKEAQNPPPTFMRITPSAKR